jgi:hypothetical protein
MWGGFFYITTKAIRDSYCLEYLPNKDFCDEL